MLEVKKILQDEMDYSLCKTYRSFVLSGRKTSRISATLTEARHALDIDVKCLDSNPFLLNTPGGIVD